MLIYFVGESAEDAQAKGLSFDSVEAAENHILFEEDVLSENPPTIFSAKAVIDFSTLKPVS